MLACFGSSFCCPCCPCCLLLMEYGRDPTPSPILQPSGDFHGQLWASGIFRGIRRWQEDHNVNLVVNCLTHGHGEILAIEEEDDRRMERTERLLKLSAALLAQGQCVLVHCKHGIHRTGSFITLLLAMLLMMSLKASMSLTSTTPTWEFVFEVAWNFWADQRGLQDRVNRKHDYYQESWTAFHEYYGQTSPDVLEEVYGAVVAAFMDACQHRRHAETIVRSIQRVLRPVQLRPAHGSIQRELQPVQFRPAGEGCDVDEGCYVRGDHDARDVSRSPRVKVPSKALPKKRPAPSSRPDVPDSSRPDVPDVPDASGSSSSSKTWRPDRIVEGEVSQMPWRPFLAGDWRCTRCGNHNMHWRGYCFGQHGRCRNPRDANFRPGDWYCQCGNLNLYYRTHCNRNKCGRSRADGGEQVPLVQSLAMCLGCP